MQYSIPLPDEVAYNSADFVVSGCNETPWRNIGQWPAWPHPVLVLHGPEASGKTHLARIWAEKSGASLFDGAALSVENIGILIAENGASKNWVLEGADSIRDEKAFFHLLNAIREQGGFLLLTANKAPAQWPMTLPDLTSRLAAIPTAELAAPDDTLLRAVVIKQLADRQLRVSEEVLNYLLARMDRSFAAARHWVARLDTASLAEQRKITIALVRQLMDEKSQQPDLFAGED